MDKRNYGLWMILIFNFEREIKMSTKLRNKNIISLDIIKNNKVISKITINQISDLAEALLIIEQLYLLKYEIAYYDIIKLLKFID